MIRVVHLITSLDVGGAQRMLLKLLAASDRSAFHSTLVSMVDGGALFDEAVATGVEVLGLGLRPGVPDPRGATRLRRVLRSTRPQILQSWLYHADLLGALVAPWVGTPRLAWNLRRSQPGGGGLRWFTTRLCAVLSKRVDLAIVNSERGRVAHEAIGYRPKRWELVPNGFPMDVFRPGQARRDAARQELGLGPDEVVALVVSRWHPDKGIDTLFQAIRRLPPEPRIHFVLVGTGLNPRNHALAEWTRAGGPGHPVELLGPRADVARLMECSDFLVSPSRTEGFPNVIGEAMSTELPCVVTDAGDSREILGPAGLVVKPEDPSALASALEEMALMTIAGRQDLGRQGRQRVADRYSLESVIGQYESLYRGLAE